MRILEGVAIVLITALVVVGVMVVYGNYKAMETDYMIANQQLEGLARACGVIMP